MIGVWTLESQGREEHGKVHMEGPHTGPGLCRMRAVLLPTPTPGWGRGQTSPGVARGSKCLWMESCLISPWKSEVGTHTADYRARGGT